MERFRWFMLCIIVEVVFVVAVTVSGLVQVEPLKSAREQLPP